ncbi:MAG TPA: hypothetical protein VF503_32570 [Sphingobium sp.]|uniref:hypothetical protein n=1 Tax=Sphingobium sp. TaxID=1912891 RepID=UPI002ED022D2
MVDLLNTVIIGQMESSRFLTTLCGAGLLAFAAPALCDPGEEKSVFSLAENSGQNVSKPLARFDTRIQYSNLPNGKQSGTITLRVDRPFSLGGGWKLNTRFDLPLALNSVTASGEPARKVDLDINDVLSEALVVMPPQGDWSFAFGTRLIAPFAKQGDLSSGKWKLGPTLSATRDLPAMGKGSFAALLVRDTFSFAGRHSSPDSNVISIQPTLHFELPKRWFITLEPEMKLNTADDWKFFVPLDAMLGKKVTDRMIISLQTDVAVINTYQNYDWKTEFRVGFFF